MSITQVKNDNEWEYLVLQSSNSTRNKKSPGYSYFQDHFRVQRELVESNKAQWFLGRVNNEVISSLGLMFTDDNIGRFQAVQTAPQSRKRGYASAMISHATRIAKEKFQIDKVVIVTDLEHKDALALYKQLGFQLVEKQLLFYLWI